MYTYIHGVEAAALVSSTAPLLPLQLITACWKPPPTLEWLVPLVFAVFRRTQDLQLTHFVVQVLLSVAPTVAAALTRASP